MIYVNKYYTTWLTIRITYLISHESVYRKKNIFLIIQNKMYYNSNMKSQINLSGIFLQHLTMQEDRCQMGCNILGWMICILYVLMYWWNENVSWFPSGFSLFLIFHKTNCISTTLPIKVNGEQKETLRPSQLYVGNRTMLLAFTNPGLAFLTVLA